MKKKCPVCQALNSRIIHHYYDKDLHKIHKVYRCLVCSNEWSEN